MSVDAGDDRSALHERDLATLGFVHQANLRLRAVLCTLARRGVALRQAEPERARQILDALAPWPLYKGGQFLFDLLEWEDFMVDGEPPPVLSHADLVGVLDLPLRWLAATAAPPLAVTPAPLRQTAAAFELPVRWLAATARSALHGAVRDLAQVLGTPTASDDGAGDDRDGPLPALESGFYLYQDVVLGLFELTGPRLPGSIATDPPPSTAGDDVPAGDDDPAGDDVPDPDGAPEPGTSTDVFPIVEPFQGGDVTGLAHDWTLHGDATLTADDGLQLTPNERDRAGTVLLNTPFPSRAGVSIEFDYYASGGNGDGFAVYLIDGEHDTGVGGYGAGLGYARGGVGERDGVTKGYLGIGFDRWGNFSTTLAGPVDGGARRPHTVALRGSGDRAEGFHHLAAVGVEGGLDAVWEDGAHVRVVIVDAVVTVSLTRAGRTTTVFDGVDLAAARGQVAVPATFKLGLSASTGYETSAHRVRNLVVTMPETTADRTSPA
ncbi:lectin-like domain-containing protein [Saccharothrix australiensis]|uniref:Concanavalin A-like lectin/glucanase superfamily protein n=1 Tax=Saccharothrix australiensis TaxID=2072 RepID=A0A495VWX3_9PSEU|nr:hypothetical protein [Saccharothrix australiensis]RKT53714.1 hypothetical protein C8E97_2293 [Saccharothrix australiensis]